MAASSQASSTRPDGRADCQLRPLAAEPAALARADGSARLAHGMTEVLVAAYGPCEAKRSREFIDRAALDVIVRPAAGLPGPAEREAEQLLSHTLAHVVLTAQHPRTAICVVVQVLADDGALLAAALHGACLALMHAGVPLRGMLGGCAAALMPDGQMLLDPCADEERAAQATVTCIFSVRRSAQGSLERQLLLSHTRGCVADEAQHARCETAAREAAVAVQAFFRQACSRVVQPLAVQEA
jgi:exosome complex component RRP46